MKFDWLYAGVGFIGSLVIMEMGVFGKIVVPLSLFYLFGIFDFKKIRK